MWEVLLDSLIDTLKLFPFLLIIYILIELLEQKASLTERRHLLQGKFAPVIATATGIVPQCGFSVMAAKLYEKGYIRTGTLLAIFIATSDEAFIILLSNGSSAISLMPLIMIKITVGLAVGYAVNFILRKESLTAMPLHIEHHDHHDHRNHHDDEEELEGYSCGRHHDEHSIVKTYIVAPLLHSLKITAYLFIVTLVFNGIVYAMGGEEVLADHILGGRWGQPLISALVGLIPTCASSVVITGAYINNGLLFGSCVAGLCANAGLGFVVLLKDTKKIKRNILLIVTLYLVAAATGVVVNAVALLF